MSDNPRLGKPSASSFSLTALCPGREALLRELPDIPEPVDEDAERGGQLHLAWQFDTPEGLDAEDVEIYERGLKLRNEVLAQWERDMGITNQNRPVEGEREERFYWHGFTGEVAASGQADCHWHVKGEHGFQGVSVLICDYKSLWCRSLVPSELNWQARLLSVLVAREYGASRTRFAFLKSMFGKADIVDYEEDDLKRAEFSVQQVLWESANMHAQRRAGAHCRHCKAASGCPEAAAWVNLPSVYAKAYEKMVGDVTPKAAAELVQQISLSDCVHVWQGTTARHNIEDACKARLKVLSSGELAELGLMFGKPKVLNPITNPMEAWSFLVMRAGIPTEKLWKAVKIGNTALAEVVQTSLGLTKKQSEEWIKDKLAPFITPQTCEKPLEKI